MTLNIYVYMIQYNIIGLGLDLRDRDSFRVKG